MVERKYDAVPRINGRISHWFEDVGAGQPRAQLGADISADIVLVGAGYTNLWAAYYLKKADPSLDIVILEREVAGFGASGRNGGWLSYGMPGRASRYAKSHGASEVVRFQKTIFAAVDEVIRVAAEEGIDADIVKDGGLTVATGPAQLHRLEAMLAEAPRRGFDAEDLRFVPQDELRRYVSIAGGIGGVWSPHTARIQPAKLARGLAEVVESLGVRIFEGTAVAEIRPHAALTADGIRATGRYVVRGTEGFTPSLRGQRRDWLPKLSSMIVTEPLSDALIEELGWHSAVMVHDAAHSFSYIQKTREGRIALGGPGVPYRYGSRTDDHGVTDARSVTALVAALHRLFPALSGTAIDHAWTGVLGIPRDWSATVRVDHASGMAVAGGYVGDGVSNSNIAGRTLRDLILRRDTPLVTLPWVGRKIRQWEPEPLRWIALTGLYWAYTRADELETARGTIRTSRLANLSNAISGRR